MLTSWLSRCSLIFFSCSFIGLAQAYSEPTNNSLQAYRDEIKQSEINASQAILDTLKANAKPDNAIQQNQSAHKPSVTMPIPRSNNDKAFSPSPANKPENTTNLANKNPWLQSNPWAEQSPTIWEENAKINPYANAPIPGPTPPNVSANAAIPSPPNIFAPSRQPLNTNNQRPKTNS